MITVWSLCGHPSHWVVGCYVKGRMQHRPFHVIIDNMITCLCRLRGTDVPPRMPLMCHHACHLCATTCGTDVPPRVALMCKHVCPRDTDNMTPCVSLMRVPPLIHTIVVLLRSYSRTYYALLRTYCASILRIGTTQYVFWVLFLFVVLRKRIKLT